MKGKVKEYQHSHWWSTIFKCCGKGKSRGQQKTASTNRSWTSGKYVIFVLALSFFPLLPTSYEYIKEASFLPLFLILAYVDA